MPPYQQQLQSYERRPTPGNPSQTEAWALLEAAKRIAASITNEHPDKRVVKKARQDALRLNWRLWTYFQADLTLEHSDVPREIRINMLTLCKFVDRHTVGAIVNPTPDALTVLIDINRNIAAGLAQLPESETKSVAEKAAPSASLEANPPAERPDIRIDTEI